jgi:hypothetical protein
MTYPGRMAEAVNTLISFLISLPDGILPDLKLFIIFSGSFNKPYVSFFRLVFLVIRIKITKG